MEEVRTGEGEGRWAISRVEELARAIMRPQTLSIAALAIIIITLLDILGGMESKPHHFILLLVAATFGLAAQVWDYRAWRRGSEAPAPEERAGRKPTARGGS
mgnify:CR=1 FL=1